MNGEEGQHARRLPEVGSRAPLFALDGVDCVDGGIRRDRYRLLPVPDRPAVLIFCGPGSTASRALQLKTYSCYLGRSADSQALLWAILTQYIEHNEVFARTYEPGLPVLADPDRAVTSAYAVDPLGPGSHHGIVVVDASGIVRATHVAQRTLPDPAAVVKALARLASEGQHHPRGHPQRYCAPIQATARDIVGRPRSRR